MNIINNLLEMVENAVEKYPNNTAYSFLERPGFEKSITYQELANKILTIANIIQQHTKLGDRVILIYPPGLDLIIAFYACLYAGCIAVLMHPPQTQDLCDKLQHIIDNSKPTLCLSTTAIVNKIQSFSSNVSEPSKWDFKKLKWETTEDVEETMSGWKPRDFSSDHIAFLQYTSGSTGMPKGVMVTHRNLVCNTNAIANQFDLSHDDEFVFWLPPYHDMGLIGAILLPLNIACPSHLLSPLSFLKSPFLWLKKLSDYQATGTAAPNFAYEHCAHYITDEQLEELNLSHLRNVLVGAEPVRNITLSNFAKKFSACGFHAEAFRPCYGLAENTLIVSGVLHQHKYSYQILNKQELQENKIQFSDEENTNTATLISCGNIIKDHVVMIIDPKTKKPCSPNKVGEIMVSGPCVSPGYWEQDKITKETMQVKIGVSKKAFLRTGDLGFIKDGELYVCGRMKDIIIIRGRNYYPQDLELAIELCLKNIMKHNSIVAFSLDIQDAENLALIVEVGRNQEINYEEVAHKILQVISEEFGLCPYHIIFVKEKTLKKTTSGKIRRQFAKEQFHKNLLNPLYIWTDNNALPDLTKNNQIIIEADIDLEHLEESIKNWIINELANELRMSIPAIDPKENIFMLGFDSIKVAALLGRLESEFNYKLSADIILEYPTINLLSHYLAVHHAEFASRVVNQTVSQ